MKSLKLLLQIVLIVLPGIVGSALGFDYSVVNFEDVLISHELWASFDFETRRFVGTESEIRCPEQLKREIEGIEINILDLERQIDSVASDSYIDLLLDNDRAWFKLAEKKELLIKLKNKRAKLVSLYNSNGRTPDTAIIPYLKRIIEHVKESEEMDKPVVFNRLYWNVNVSEPPFLDNPFSLFLQGRSKEILEDYLDKSFMLFPFFPFVSEPVIFDRRSSIEAP